MSELTSSDLDYMHRTARLYMNPSHNPRPLLASAADTPIQKNIGALLRAD